MEQKPLAPNLCQCLLVLVVVIGAPKDRKPAGRPPLPGQATMMENRQGDRHCQGRPR